jgi:MinD-like ATPase involved in chromosome partitioning or flagellar assembly
MADEEGPTEQELEARRRASAQDAAGDLARMGVDPRLLGLDPVTSQHSGQPPATEPRPSQPPAPPTPAAGEGAGGGAGPGESAPGADQAPPSAHGDVVPLRPEFAGPAPMPVGPPPPSTPPATPAINPALGPPPGHYLAPPTEPAPAPQPASAATPYSATSAPVEELLARTAAGKPAPSTSGRWMKAVTFGLVTPDAAETVGSERMLVGALRTRQADRRVVAFNAGKGGVGATTVAMGVATAFAALRDDPTVLVDAHSGTASLGQMLGVPAALTGRDLVADADAEPTVVPGGLRVVDGCGWGTPLRRADVPPLLDRLGRDHVFTLVDVGNDPGEAAYAALARSDQTVIVTCAGAWGLSSARVAAARLRDVDTFAIDRAIYVVVCTNDESYRKVHREVMQQLAQGPVRAVVVPPDPELAAGQPFDPGRVRPATREAMLEVAAAIAVTSGVH